MRKSGFSSLESLCLIGVVMILLLSYFLKFHNNNQEHSLKKQTESITNIVGKLTVESVPTEKEQFETSVPSEKEYNWFGIKNFGLGIYYFSQTGNNFGETLKSFLSCHTNLEISAAAESAPNTGVTIGYFVMFREKK